MATNFSPEIHLSHRGADRPTANWRLGHGVLFVFLVACTLMIPRLRSWPWLWVAPLGAYVLLVYAIPGLRNSLTWLHAGVLTRKTIIATVALIICTIAVLLAFQTLMEPDRVALRNIIPLRALGSALLAGIIFTIVNATLEEFVFRGILFDAAKSQWGPLATVIGTGALFGLGHLHGYPPGRVGTCLATIFGVALGGLRLWTGGVLLPIVAHMAADATIYFIIVIER